MCFDILFRECRLVGYCLMLLNMTIMFSMRLPTVLSMFWIAEDAVMRILRRCYFTFIFFMIAVTQTVQRIRSSRICVPETIGSHGAVPYSGLQISVSANAALFLI